ncbi:sushi, von Willebrand factor type A, EGF and pentraxin domain-containing protein 1-like [Halichondria panicea]|uniref:sushi, von Willebrand factor type A, EGF and pentraxin domain-containing protein 1-like n=1 Tax=Halichondria panicea TaxID=6063 RepID=UPI00312B7D0A
MGLNTVATYTCNIGYALTGDTIRSCWSDGVWSGSAPTCQVATVTCSDDLPTISNGGITYMFGFTNSRPVGATATYICFSGYRLTGVSVRTCGSDGLWSSITAPVCEVITCFDLSSLVNGNVHYGGAGSPGSRPVDTVVTYNCNTGFTLTGGSTRTCGSDGMWSGSAPTCQQITCTDLLSPPNNGAISYNGGSTDIRPINTIATHSCNTGYTLNGEFSCGPPPSITNGYPGQPTSTMIGGEAIYTCDTGFILIGFETIMCLSTGNWSTSPSCQTPPPVYLSLSSTNYLSGLSEIPLSSMGEGSGLVCHTDLAGCCEGNTGDWYYPNGSVVMEDGALYVSRGQMSVSLMMSGTATAPGGVYCCVVPTSGGMSTACNVLASTDDHESSESPSRSDNTGAVVGGVVALVAVVVIAVTVVMVTYLVLRYKRGGKMTVTQDIPLTEQGQSAAATYETVHATYKEIPASREVKGDYSYTQNNSYLTVSGHDNTETPAVEI